ncbi:hypothetical protein GCM10010411_74740 [Actinomadura fulvescens]|uniref:Uncharacterized protein n=1 Tax=Actinomadura fulvescens TaxID=46160 RepID=A0ABP6CV56_9ACTN
MVNAVITVLCVPWLLLMGLPAVASAAEGGSATGFAVVLTGTGVLVVASLVISWVGEYQRAYWLDGTCLIRRKLRSEQRCDLTVAAVTADSMASVFGPSIPKLTAAEPGAPPITLRLRVKERWNQMLPAAELTLLAEAISARPQMDDQTAAVVNGLRAMASNPFGTSH